MPQNSTARRGAITSGSGLAAAPVPTPALLEVVGLVRADAGDRRRAGDLGRHGPHLVEGDPVERGDRLGGRDYLAERDSLAGRLARDGAGALEREHRAARRVG